MRHTIVGALLGSILLPVVVLGLTAVLHYLRFGNWTEFWGLILAIRAIPYGFVLGAILTLILRRKR